MEYIREFFTALLSVLRTFGLKDLLDILVVAFIIYSLNKLVRETRAIQLIKGIVVLLVTYLIATVFDFIMLGSLMKNFFEFSVIVIFIVFQPEIRRMLEQIGRSQISAQTLKLVTDKDGEAIKLERKRMLNSVLGAVALFSHTKTGALIVFERRTKLGDIADTGTQLNAEPSAKLIGNIFFNKAPLHDGAMIIRDNYIYAAGCILPLTKKEEGLDPHIGTRHRAAIGMSEESDAVVLIVSEETGVISLACNGKLTRNYTRETLEATLEELLFRDIQENDVKKRLFLPFRFWRKENNDGE